MNRKQFIKQSSSAAAGMLFIPSMLRNQKMDDMILGHNNKRYRINTKWSQLSFEQYPVKDCHEMVQDKLGRIILLTNETKNNVIIYDKSGKLITTWGHEYPGAHGLTLFNENGDDVLFICDNSRHQVSKTTVDGRVLMTLDYPKEIGLYTKAEEYVPTETAIARNGDIYVTDGYGKDFIIQYDYKGNYIRHFGGRGDGDKYLMNAHGICVDYRDKNRPCLVVSSRQQNAFKRFTLDGVYIDTIPLPGAWVCRPVIKGEYLYAAVLQTQARQGEQSGFVTILDKNFNVVSNLAGSQPKYTNNTPDEMYQTIKVFQYPHDVCIDDEENLYVAQWNSGHVYPYKLQPV
ncbi:6-bladed beta-propeller [Chitinophagaceae bacterium LB-8]|uniref:6-bladed beta-propeller n=1 Tax=Paraflavisolibacter caeni TaxID=2982496 RepID=A0A9X3BJ26_9BACT|nr:6-bladed beta-propeller [Paraflavisolibacter caeni]MCU7552202.1 6-bladed beta-propeller [Paraflavisolibacter caeni]